MPTIICSYCDYTAKEGSLREKWLDVVSHELFSCTYILPEIRNNRLQTEGLK